MFKVMFLVSVLLISTKALSYDIFSELDSCSRQCSQRCLDLSNRINESSQRVLQSCNSQLPVDQNLYKDAYDFAYSSGGMNMSSQAARDFADKITSQYNGRQSLSAFKEAYNFAYSSGGMNMSSQAARDFAWKIADQINPQQALYCYRTAYNFAYSSGGMNLSSQGARDHAEKTCRIQK